MERFYWAALGTIEGLGQRNIPALVDYFGSAEAVYKASFDDFRSSKLPLKIAGVKIFIRKRKPELPEKLSEFCCKNKVKLLTYADKDYPALLKEIAVPPLALYIKGNLPEQDTRVAVVGSRRATAYGLKVASEFAGVLAKAGVTIVSGGAKGIDTAAHKGSLIAKGTTLAVLGTGIDMVYPRENTRLFAEIAEKGALMTEFAPGTPPLGGNFPRRNRIVSGMAQGVLVVEAAKKSGAMITIGFALEEGRNVYCVPGSIYLPNSIGCHTLIKEGAMLVDTPHDILRDMNIATDEPFMPSLFKINKSLNQESKHILNLLSEGPQTLEILAQASGLPLASLSEALLNLEFKGSVAHMQDQRYYRI